MRNTVIICERDNWDGIKSPPMQRDQYSNHESACSSRDY
jgi:hypothetical protein